MPDLVRHHLILRGLLHKADLRRLTAAGDLGQRRAAEGDLPLPQAMGRQHRFQLPQQRGFSAAGWAAEHHERTLRHGEGDMGQRRAALLGVGKAVILQMQKLRHRRTSFSICLHWRAAARSSAAGVRHSRK